jgi:hypothetical protein
VASGDDFILPAPNQASEGKKARGDIQHRPGRLVGRARIDNCNATIMADERKGIPVRGEAAAMHPPGRVIEKFTAHGVEGQALAPCCRLRPLVDALDVAREDPRMRVGRAGG